MNISSKIETFKKIFTKIFRSFVVISLYLVDILNFPALEETNFLADSAVSNSINEDTPSPVFMCKRMFAMRPNLVACFSIKRTVKLGSCPFQNTTCPFTDSVIFGALGRGGPSFSSNFWADCTQTDVVSHDGDSRRVSEGESDGSFVMFLSTHLSFTTAFLCSTTEICSHFDQRESQLLGKDPLFR